MKKVLFYSMIIFLSILIQNAFSQTKHIAKEENSNEQTLGILLGVQMPMDNFSYSVKTGFGFSGIYNNFINRNFEIHASAGYNIWGAAKTQPGETGSIDDIPLLFGFNFVIPYDKTRFYLGLEAGVHFLNVSDSYQGYNFSLSESNFGFGLNFGGLFSISKSTYFNANLKYNQVLAGTKFKELQFFGINVGFSFSLNKN